MKAKFVVLMPFISVAVISCAEPDITVSSKSSSAGTSGSGDASQTSDLGVDKKSDGNSSSNSQGSAITVVPPTAIKDLKTAREWLRSAPKSTGTSFKVVGRSYRFSLHPVTDWVQMGKAQEEPFRSDGSGSDSEWNAAEDPIVKRWWNNRGLVYADLANGLGNFFPSLQIENVNGNQLCDTYNEVFVGRKDVGEFKGAVGILSQCVKMTSTGGVDYIGYHVSWYHPSSNHFAHRVEQSGTGCEYFDRCPVKGLAPVTASLQDVIKGLGGPQYYSVTRYVNIPPPAPDYQVNLDAGIGSYKVTGATATEGTIKDVFAGCVETPAGIAIGIDKFRMVVSKSAPFSVIKAYGQWTPKSPIAVGPGLPGDGFGSIGNVIGGGGFIFTDLDQYNQPINSPRPSVKIEPVGQTPYRKVTITGSQRLVTKNNQWATASDFSTYVCYLRADSGRYDPVMAKLIGWTRYR